MNNNTVLKKLRIAFSLKTDDIRAIMSEQKYRVSVPEITAMMRSRPQKLPRVRRPVSAQFPARTDPAGA